MKGSLVCVGTGMKLAAHITPISQSHIEQADVVFSLLSCGITEKWLEQKHNNIINLQNYYAAGKSRNITYQEMVAAILTEVRKDKKVVVAFYGHPGVFACVSHRALKQAKAEGYIALMEPGVSADDCLYAELGIDPGTAGIQHFETSQFMFYKRQIDPSAYLVLWQVGMAGDKSLGKITTDNRYRKILVELLSSNYPLDHEVILYETATTPLESVRAEYISLAQLPNAEVTQQTTLVIPPSQTLEKNHLILKQLEDIDKRFLQLVK